MKELKALKKQAADAEREMRDWLVRDGKQPTKVEVLGRINGPAVTFFAMQFQVPEHDGWLLGVAGGYLEDTLTLTGHTVSSYQPVTENFGEDATSLIAAMDRALSSGAVAEGRDVAEYLSATLLLNEPAHLERVRAHLGGRVEDDVLYVGNSRITTGPELDKLGPIAERAYLWPDAKIAVSHHTARLVVDTAGTDHLAQAEEHARRVTELIDSSVLGISANGTLYEPAFYRQVVDTTPAGTPPVLVLVQLGLAKRMGKLHGFTEGLADIGKDEFLLEGDSPEELQRVLLELASHILVTGAVISDDTNLTLSTGQVLHLTRKGSGENAALTGSLKDK